MVILVDLTEMKVNFEALEEKPTVLEANIVSLENCQKILYNISIKHLLIY